MIMRSGAQPAFEVRNQRDFNPLGKRSSSVLLLFSKPYHFFLRLVCCPERCYFSYMLKVTLSVVTHFLCSFET